MHSTPSQYTKHHQFSTYRTRGRPASERIKALSVGAVYPASEGRVPGRTVQMLRSPTCSAPWTLCKLGHERAHTNVGGVIQACGKQQECDASNRDSR